MPYRSISHETKELLVELYLGGFLSQNDVLATGVFSYATFRRLLIAWTSNGLPPRRYSSGRPRKLGADDLAYVVGKIEQSRDIYLDEIMDDLVRVGGTSSSLSTLCRTLQRLQVSRKKLTKRALEASVLDQADFKMRMSRYRLDQLIFIDETGFESRVMQRQYGRAEKGSRALKVVTGKRGRRVTLIPGLTTQGIIAPVLFRHTVNTQVFYDYLARYLLPLTSIFPGPRSVLVMDNVPFHRSHSIRQLVARYGCKIEYTSAWSPTHNPIEESFSKIKAYMRRHCDSSDYAVLRACDAITPSDAVGWMRHAGYE